MSGDLILSFPHMGDYGVVFAQVLRHLFPGAKILPAPPMTQRTAELGGRYSPEFVCSPFKFNLGNYLEALEQGANVLFQTGLGCRYGYYGELQEQILRDLGYQFRFVCHSRQRAKPAAACEQMRQLGCTLPSSQMLYVLAMAVESIRIMDRYEFFMRENVGLRLCPLLLSLCGAAPAADRVRGFPCGRCSAPAGRRRRRASEDRQTGHPLRVGMVGDLYTLMDHTASSSGKAAGEEAFPRRM